MTYSDAHLIDDPISHWMCSGCHRSGIWFAERTPCCGKRATRAFSDVPCPFCASGVERLVGWNLYDDGITRPCVCSPLEPRSPLPNPDWKEGVAALALAAVVNGFVPGLFPVPVYRSTPSVSQEGSKR